VAAGEGAIIVTGNTSAQRGKANFAGFGCGLTPLSTAGRSRGC
jgi:hypothetical protein